MMLRIGAPAVVSSILFSLYNLTDAYWIGQLRGAHAMAAMAGIQTSWPFVWLLISLIAGFAGAAVSALVAQNLGANRPEDANHAMNQLFVVGVSAGFIVGVVGLVVAQFVLPSFFADPAVAHEMTTYLRIIFLGVHTMLLPQLAASVFYAAGNTLLPVLVTLVGVGLNIPLDRILVLGWTSPVGFPLRIVVPQLGITGAAYATIIAQGVSALIFLALLSRRHRPLRLERRLMRPDRRLLRKATRIGLPASLGQAAVAFGFAVMAIVIGRLPNSAAALSGYGVADRIFGLLFIATDGLGVGLTTMVGQALGAGLLDRTRILVSKGIRALLVVVLVEAVVLYFARRPLVAVFLPGNADAIREGTTFIALFAASMPFLCAFFAAEAVYRGAGHNMPVFWLGVIRLWGLRIPLSLLFAFALRLGSTGVWLGMSTSNVFSGIAAMLWLRTGSWQRAVVEPTKTTAATDGS